MDYTNLKERMEKSIGAFKEKLSEIRAGRANPAILNKVKIDYYGTPTPINQVAGKNSQYVLQGTYRAIHTGG